MIRLSSDRPSAISLPDCEVPRISRRPSSAPSNWSRTTNALPPPRHRLQADICKPRWLSFLKTWRSPLKWFANRTSRAKPRRSHPEPRQERPPVVLVQSQLSYAVYALHAPPRALVIVPGHIECAVVLLNPRTKPMRHV